MNAKLYQAACDLFHKAVLLTPETRDRFLQQSCRGNAQLFQLVQELLTNDPLRSSGGAPIGPPAEDDTLHHDQ